MSLALGLEAGTQFLLAWGWNTQKLKSRLGVKEMFTKEDQGHLINFSIGLKLALHVLPSNNWHPWKIRHHQQLLFGATALNSLQKYESILRLNEPGLWLEDPNMHNNCVYKNGSSRFNGDFTAKNFASTGIQTCYLLTRLGQWLWLSW